MYCYVSGCKNYNNKFYKHRRAVVSYFRFPKDPKLSKIWVRFCRRKDVVPTRTGRVCSDHFTPDDMESNVQFELGFMSKKRIRLKPGTVPSVYKRKDNDDSFGRKSRIIARENKKIINKLLMESTNVASTNNVETEDEEECIFETSLENAPPDPIDVTTDCEKYVSLKSQMDAITNQAETEDEECVTDTSLENALPDSIDVTTDCEKCVSLKSQMDALHLKMNTLEKRCEQFILSESVLKDKIKSLELELEQRKMQSTENVKKVATISSDVQKIEEISSSTNSKQRWSKVDIDESKKFYSANSKVYKLLRTKGVQLPSVRTLQRWAKNKRDGIPEPVAKSLKATTVMDVVQID